MLEHDTILPVFETGTFTVRAWKGLPLEVAVVKGSRMRSEICVPEAMISVQTSEKPCFARWHDERKKRQYLGVRDAVCFWRKGHSARDLYTADSHSGLAVFLPQQRIEEFLQEDARACLAGLNSIDPLVFSFDPFAAQALHTMAAEIEDGCPSGAVFAQSLSTALLMHLSGRWQRTEATQPVSSADPVGIRRVREFIEANLAEDLSLTELSKIASLSPRHLSRNFKQAEGTKAAPPSA